MAKSRKDGKGGAKNPGDAAAQDLDKQRRVFVETLAGYGMAAAEIGLLMVPAIAGERVEADYKLELELGPAKANLEAVAQLRAGVKKGNVTACIYWTKSRMGWSEKGKTSDLPPGEKTPRAEESDYETPVVMPEGLEDKILNFPNGAARPGSHRKG